MASSWTSSVFVDLSSCCCSDHEDTLLHNNFHRYNRAAYNVRPWISGVYVPGLRSPGRLNNGLPLYVNGMEVDASFEVCHQCEALLGVGSHFDGTDGRAMTEWSDSDLD